MTFSERLGNNTIVSVGPLTVILHGCSTMSLHIVGRGVCLVPDMPEELTSVLLFWTFVQRVLKVSTCDRNNVNLKFIQIFSLFLISLNSVAKYFYEVFILANFRGSTSFYYWTNEVNQRIT